MGHFALGFKALFRVWTDDAFASQVGKWLGIHPTNGEEAAAPPSAAPSLPPAAPLPRQPRAPHTITPNIKLKTDAPKPEPATPPARSEALSLLAVLQRDARLLDFLKESITGYTDAQVGAAARNVHKEAAAVVDRLFGVEPLTMQAEGSTVEVPAGYDPAKFRLTGNVPGSGAAALRGTLVHPGWKAVRADVPAWNGKGDAAYVLAPLEVEF